MIRNVISGISNGMEPGTLGLEGRDLTTAPTPPLCQNLPKKKKKQVEGLGALEVSNFIEGTKGLR